MLQDKKRISNADLDSLVKEINLNMSDLFKMKERGRIILGQFINSEVLNFNRKNDKVSIYPLTYMLDFHGELQGKIYLNLKPEIAIYLGGILFNEELISVTENVDEAMKEILNIFSGHLATFFHEHKYKIDIGVPSETDVNFLKTKVRKKILFRFTCKEHVLQIVMAIN